MQQSPPGSSLIGKKMRIGQLAKRTGVSPDTLRFYERLDLLDGHRRDNGYRDYPDSAIDRVEFIKLAQALGFTLAEIRSIAPMLTGGTLPVEQVQAFIHDKLTLLDQRIATLQTLSLALTDQGRAQDRPRSRKSDSMPGGAASVAPDRAAQCDISTHNAAWTPTVHHRVHRLCDQKWAPRITCAQPIASPISRAAAAYQPARGNRAERATQKNASSANPEAA